MKVSGIVKTKPTLVLDEATINRLTEKAVKATNEEVGNRLRVLKSSNTKINHATEKLTDGINALQDQFKDNEEKIRKFVLLIEAKAQL